MTEYGEILVYHTDDGTVRLDVRLHDETVWLTDAMMAELFACSVDNVSLRKGEKAHRKYRTKDTILRYCLQTNAATGATGPFVSDFDPLPGTRNS